ncbi:hypothetical protein [Fimbriimonas ginsengisoli]|uniref:Uncharacterized protein n=1 Tax=Fimbriimonas ginsengisoli Gsoil 348 TaxID=661478 RepID=A0A068NVT7_FIMGI|nr:hypothetical protein [Fimbriimonas ginsengisoli]AIE87623.1 hypothetical protein OP10G_4255 [Fimbriimonas ginsengisoli Gsoil 348]
MNSTAGKVILAIIGFFVAIWAIKLVVGTVLALVYTVLPIALVAGALYVGYRIYNGKALGGGRRTLP